MSSPVAFLAWTCTIGLVCLAGVWGAAWLEDRYERSNTAERWPRPRRLP